MAQHLRQKLGTLQEERTRARSDVNRVFSALRGEIDALQKRLLAELDVQFSNIEREYCINIEEAEGMQRDLETMEMEVESITGGSDHDGQHEFKFKCRGVCEF